MSVKEIFGAVGTLNWGIILILFTTIWVWYAIFTIGFFHTLFWISLGGIIGGLYGRYKENN